MLGTCRRRFGSQRFAAAISQAASWHGFVFVQWGRLQSKAKPAFVRVEVGFHRHWQPQRLREESLCRELAHVGAQTLRDGQVSQRDYLMERTIQMDTMRRSEIHPACTHCRDWKEHVRCVEHSLLLSLIAPQATLEKTAKEKRERLRRGRLHAWKCKMLLYWTCRQKLRMILRYPPCNSFLQGNDTSPRTRRPASRRSYRQHCSVPPKTWRRRAFEAGCGRAAMELCQRYLRCRTTDNSTCSSTNGLPNLDVKQQKHVGCPQLISSSHGKCDPNATL